MVIQRIQTLFLLLAAIFMGVFVCIPMASVNALALHPYDVDILLVINLLIIVLLVLGIFMFKNLKRQMTVTLVSMVLIACSAATSAFVLFKGQEPDADVQIGGSLLLLLVALICAVLAYRGMKKDKKLLSSYDRLR